MGSPSVALEFGIYGSHIIWRIRYRRVLREAKDTGISVDDLLDQQSGCTQENSTTKTVVSGDIESQGTAAVPADTACLEKADRSDKT